MSIAPSPKTVVTARRTTSQTPPAKSSSGGGGASIDPFRVLRRHLLLLIVAGIVGLFLGVGTFYLLNKYAPLYTSSVLFELQPKLGEANTIMTGELTQDSMVVRMAKTETSLITEPVVLGKVLAHPEIQNLSWAKKYRKAGGFDAETAMSDLRDELSAGYRRNTNLFTLSWSAENRNDVPIMLDRIAMEYLKLRRSWDESSYENNQQLFRDKLTNIERQIDDQTEANTQFIRNHGIVTLDDSRYSQDSMAVDELMMRKLDAKANLSTLNSQIEMTEAKLAGTMNPTAEDRLMAERESIIQRLNSQISELEISHRLALEQYNPNHAVVKEREQRLRAAEASKKDRLETILQQNLSGSLKNLKNQRQNLVQLTESLEEEYRKKETRQRELTGYTAEYRSLKKRLERLEEQRNTYQNMIADLSMIKAREDTKRVRIRQQARRPRGKSFPKLTIIVPLCTMLVVGLTLGVIFLRELTDQRIKSAADLEVLPHARVLGVIPELGDDPTKSRRAELVVRDNPQGVLAESYRLTTAPINKAMSRAQHQTLLLVGGLPGAGTTTVATNLAAANAAAGKRVLAIDANYRRPHLARAMGVESDSPGLGDILSGESSIEEAVRVTESGVDVIPAGTPANRIFDFFSNTRFDSILAQLREDYDLILIDAPPAVVAGDAFVLANKVDAGVLVVRAYQEHRGLVNRVANQLSDSHCELLGIVLNRPKGTAGGYFKKNYATMAAYGDAKKT